MIVAVSIFAIKYDFQEEATARSSEVGIYKRKVLSKKERKHAFDQENKKENTILTKK